MTVTDWRTHDTPAARAQFEDAQYRLDTLSFAEDGYTPEMRAADEQIADRYNRLVLQAAHEEFEQRCYDDEFDRRFPEPADGQRIEWESGGKVWGAYRQDDSETEVGTWYLYGDDKPYTWQSLLVEYEISMDDLTILVPATEER